MLQEFVCAWCGTKFLKYPCQVKRPELAFCCQACVISFRDKRQNPDGYKSFADYSVNSERMRVMNAELNPTRMTEETRARISETRRGQGVSFDTRRKISRVKQGNPRSVCCKGYKKILGRHEHRIVAESMLGRALKKGEVVHHVDGDIHNNAPDNLMVFSSQSEHVKWHKANDPAWGKKGAGHEVGAT